jgi:hypothetical protein
MALGADTGVVNGQRFTFPTAAGYNPISWGPQTSGVPQVSPSMPPFIGGTGSVGGNAVAEGVGGYGTAANNTTVTGVANANPWNAKVSPVWWAIVFMVVGLLLLKGTSWRETTLEGFEERAHVGPAREAASEEA